MSRPRGFIAGYNPRTKTRALLAQVEAVLGTYQAELPLTARQVFYRLVGAHGYPKDEAAYGRLQEHLANARRAGLIDFAHIRDDGTAVEAPVEYASPEEFLRIAEELAAEGQGVTRHFYVAKRIWHLWLEGSARCSRPHAESPAASRAFAASRMDSSRMIDGPRKLKIQK